MDYFSAAFFLRNPVVGGLGQDELSIARERFVGDGMQDHVVVQNHSHRRVEFELAFEVGNDFADIFAVKDWDFALGDPEHAQPLPDPVPLATTRRRTRSRSRIAEFGGVTQLFFSEPGEVDGSHDPLPARARPRASAGACGST